MRGITFLPLLAALTPALAQAPPEMRAGTVTGLDELIVSGHWPSSSIG